MAVFETRVEVGEALHLHWQVLLHFVQSQQADVWNCSILQVSLNLSTNGGSQLPVQGGESVQRRLASMLASLANMYTMCLMEQTHLTEDTLKTNSSGSFAHARQFACLCILREIDNMITYRHGAARLAIWSRYHSVWKALQREGQLVESRGWHRLAECTSRVITVQWDWVEEASPLAVESRC